MKHSEHKDTGYSKTLAWLLALSAVGMPLSFAEELAAEITEGAAPAATNRQEQGLWDTPAARQAIATLYRYHELRVEALAAAMQSNSRMTRNEATAAARTMVQQEGTFVARRALHSAPLAQLLAAVGTNAEDEADLWKPELVWGLAEALERRDKQFAFRGDGKDAYRAEALEHVLARLDMDAVAADDLRSEMEGRTRSKDFTGKRSSIMAAAMKGACRMRWMTSISPSAPRPAQQQQASVTAAPARSAATASRSGVMAVASTASAAVATGASQVSMPHAVATAATAYSVAGQSGSFAGSGTGSSGGSAGGSGAGSFFSLAEPDLDSQPDTPTPERGVGDSHVWDGDVSKLEDGVEMKFDKSSKALDVNLDKEWRPWSILVDDTGVTQTNRAPMASSSANKIGYAFTGEGYIADYMGDDGSSQHATSLTKKGSGILVMDNAKNSFSGGVDLQEGVLYVAEQGALGTGAVTMHNGTQMWVNYTWNNDYNSSFRNPSVSNAIKLDGAATSATISYGNFPYERVLGKDSSRIWRNMYLTGGVSGAADSHLFLQGYTSRYAGAVDKAPDFTRTRTHLGGTATLRGQLWYAGFTLNRSEADAYADRFYGTVTLGNRVNSNSGDDALDKRETGAVKLILSDDVLEYATLDATRDFGWFKDGSSVSGQTELLLNGTVNGATAADYTVSATKLLTDAYAAAGGTDKNYGTYGLHQTHSNVILISNNTKVGELKAALLGVTQDSYKDAIDWSESLETKMVRVVTLEHNSMLTLGKKGSAAESWFSGTVGLEDQLCDLNIDGLDAMTAANMDGHSETPTTVAGVSITKVGDNAQYIHTAEVNNLHLESGTLGFNNVKLVSNLSVESGSKLRLGVQDGVWTNEGSVHLTVGEDTTSAHRLSVITTEADKNGAPLSARVEGSLNMNTSTEIIFEVSSPKQESGERSVIIPVSVKEDELSKIKANTAYLSSHSLLQVTSATGRTEGLETGGTLTLGNNTPLSISGINFLREDYKDKVYFLAAADNISVTGNGVAQSASDFSDRVISLGYGFYGIISSIDGHGFYKDGTYVSYDTGSDSYLGQDYLVMRVAADPTRSWTGAGYSAHTDASNIWKSSGDETYEHYLKNLGTEPDVQWKENRAYTDGVSVKFGNLWIPAEWEKYLKDNPTASLTDFTRLLTSNIVTKVGDELFSDAPLPDTKQRTSNGVAVEFGGVTYGSDGSYYSPASTEGPSNHYEQVMIDGTVSPGYVTVNSDFNLKQGEGLDDITVKDDTNYVFTDYVDADGVVHTGCIADASAKKMNEIYAGLLSDATDASVLDNWKTGLAKGGTGTLVIQTENSYSGGSLLRGGLTVMKNQWALGMEDPTLDKTNPAARGGNIEMAYGAGLMVDYYAANTNTGLGFEGATPTGRLTNNLLITHMADFDNTGATGDAQLFNNADAVTLVARLSSYDDAILTLRGASYSEADAIAKFGKPLHTYAAYIFQDPVEAYGTIRMAGYLQGADGRLVDENGQTYKNTGGNVQLTVVGHNTPIAPNEARWKNTTLDLSLNGSAHNVVALGSAFENGQPNREGVNHYIYIGTIKDNGDVRDEDGNICAAIVSDAGADSFGSTMSPTEKYMVNLTLEPGGDAHFNGNMGFGTVQNNKGELIDSRGYLSLNKVGPAAQTIGNARLYDLNVKDAGLLHVTGSLSAHSITTAAVGVQHIHIGQVEDATASHTLIVGKGGVLSFDATTMTGSDPLGGLQGAESDYAYAAEVSYVLLHDGATLTAGSNWQTGKAMSVTTGAEVTFNTHDYSMDPSVTSDMATTYKVDADLQNAFDSSHIIKMTTALSGSGVTLNLVNEQMSAGATEDEKGKASANGYIVSHDLNAYAAKNNTKVNYGLQDNSVVNIGSKTILQITDTAKTDSGIAYNVKGTDAALQFLESGTSGYSSYVHDATVAEGGRILFGGASVATSGNSVNTDKINADITKGTDVIITNKTGLEATVQNVAHNTANTTVSGVTYETTIKGKGADTDRAVVQDAVLIVKSTGSKAVNNTLVQQAAFKDTLMELEEKCSLSLGVVVADNASQIIGSGTKDGAKGETALTKGATAASDQAVAEQVASFSTGSVALTDPDTSLQSTLTSAGTVELGTGSVYIANVDQVAQVDVSGTGLTLQVNLADIKAAAASGAKVMAFQVTGSGRFLYEDAGVLDFVKLTDYNGKPITGAVTGDKRHDPAYVYHFVSHAEVAALLNVQNTDVTSTMLYIVLPEPTTTTLSLLALTALLQRRKRK